ncbi:MAG: GNAT family N-acetyltransferase [Proteobacteria bacterium]|nr:GNAT family N-acetyltransferase [Pseudomonadota bacterium]
MTIRYLDLRDCRDQADGVAGRVWAAFWRYKGTPLSTIRAGLELFLRPESRIPFVVVAESDGTLCGNALVIDNDEASRPDLTPWIAALWVDEPFRRRGIAAALMDEAARRVRSLGIDRLYLVSRPTLRDFYVGLGWKVLEDNVGAHRLTLYVKELGAVPLQP